MAYKIFSFLFLAVGIWAIMDGTIRALEGVKAKSWPIAKGRILISRYEQWRTTRDVRVAGLCIDIQYLYQVGDKIFEGSRLNTGWRCFGNQRHIEDVLRNYPSGKEVTVRYNPKDPKQSLLEPGIDWTCFFLWGIGLISISVGLPLFWRSMRP